MQKDTYRPLETIARRYFASRRAAFAKWYAVPANREKFNAKRRKTKKPKKPRKYKPRFISRKKLSAAEMIEIFLAQRKHLIAYNRKKYYLDIEASRKYYREYFKKRYKKNRREMLLRNKEYYFTHRDEILARHARYRIRKRKEKKQELA